MLVSNSFTGHPLADYDNTLPHCPRSTARLIRRILWCAVAAVALASPGGAQEPDGAGSFEVRAASAELEMDVYFINALIDFRLSDEARQALHAGVPLIVRIETELIHNRRFWFDDEHADLEQRFLIEYHSLTERYLVRNLNSADQSSFTTLSSALSFLGRVERLPFIDLSLLEEDRSYDVRIRAELDMDEFSGPLRLLTFWRRDFSLSSDWYRWRLRGD